MDPVDQVDDPRIFEEIREKLVSAGAPDRWLTANLHPLFVLAASYDGTAETAWVMPVREIVAEYVMRTRVLPTQARQLLSDGMRRDDVSHMLLGDN